MAGGSPSSTGVSDDDGASAFELAVVAVQTRAGIARLREYNSFAPADEIALDRVMKLLADMIPQR